MRQRLMKVINWIGWLSCIGILCSFFIPFMGFERESDSYSLIGYLFDICSDGMGNYADAIYIFLFMNIGVFVSAIVSAGLLRSFSSRGKKRTAIFLLVIAIVGMLLTKFICNAIFSESWFEMRIGAFILKGSSFGIFIAGILALFLTSAYMFRGQLFQDMIVQSRCPQCGKNITADSKFCTGCGFSMEVYICPKCGAKRKSDFVYCENCGEKLPKLPVLKTTEEKKEPADIEDSELEIDGVAVKNAHCQKCGYWFSETEKVCPKCGKDSKIVV